jgi:hypothetical protein
VSCTPEAAGTGHCGSAAGSRGSGPRTMMVAKYRIGQVRADDVGDCQLGQGPSCRARGAPVSAFQSGHAAERGRDPERAV